MGTSLSWTAPVSGDILLSVGHVHAGAINITLFINDEEACTTVPIYGTQEGVPGNEKGYLVGNPACVKTDHVKVGDKITVTSHYWVGHGVDPSGSLLPGGFHGGTMDYFYLAIDAGSLLDADGNAVDDVSQLMWPAWQEEVIV